MKYHEKTVFLTLFLVTTIFNYSSANAGTSNESPEAALKSNFPKLKYKAISKTDIGGIYEVNTGDRIVYFYPKKGYVLVGDIFTKEGRNLTKKSMEEEKFKSLTSEDLKKGIKIGNGKNVVVEVTDPECPYCRKMHVYWSMRPDVTRYVFFKPLDMHPDARKMAEYILNAKDPERAMFEVYCGSLDNKKDILKKANDDNLRLKEQIAVADKLLVTGTPSYWVNGKFVSGADIALIESIIGKSVNVITNQGTQNNDESNCGGK